MRVRPIAPVLFLEPNDDTVIADVQVPRGTPVFALSMYHARRDSHFAHGCRVQERPRLAQIAPQDGPRRRSRCACCQPDPG